MIPTRTSHTPPPVRPRGHASVAVLLALMLTITLGSYGVMASASVYSFDVYGDADDLLGNQLGHVLTVAGGNSWDNATNDSRITYEEIAAAAGDITPVYDISEFSPGLSIDDVTSNRSLEVAFGGDTPPSSSQHGWKSTVTGAVAVEFDFAVSNDTNSSDSSFGWRLCRSSLTAGLCTTSTAYIRATINLGNTTVPASVALYNGVGWESSLSAVDYANSTSYNNADWIHVVLGWHSNASGDYFYAAVGDLWVQFQNVSMPDDPTEEWMLHYSCSGDICGGDFSYWIDNMYFYGGTPVPTAELTLEVLNGNLTTRMSAFTTDMTSILGMMLIASIILGLGAEVSTKRG